MTVGTSPVIAQRGCAHIYPGALPGVGGRAGALDADTASPHHVDVSGWARGRLYAAIATGAVGLLVAWGYAIYAQLDSVWHHLAWTGVVVVPLYALALWLVRHRPDHPQARRLLLAASITALSAGVESVFRGIYRDLGEGTWVWLVNFGHQYLGLVAGTAGGVLLLCYPDGKAERPWQRRLVIACWCSLALPLLLLVTRQDLVISPYLFEGRAPEPPASPFTVEWLTPLGPVVYALYASSGAAVIGAIALLTRYVRSGTTQRRRMRPLVYTIFLAAPLVAAIAVMALLGVPEDSAGFVLVSALLRPVLFMFPVSIAISVLRYRAFDIDLDLRRSAVYGVLVAGIAAAYVALAATPGLALGNQIPVQLAVALTVGTAVVFHPLRRRLERLADRWVFGDGADRYRVVTSFGATLEQTVEMHALLPRLAQTIRDGLSAAWVRVRLRGDAPDTWLAGPMGVTGTPAGDPLLVVELRHQGEVVGRIECGPKQSGTGGGEYAEADRELLSTLAGQAATAIANLRLTARLSEQVSELAQSRARIVAAQDGERRRIERDIHDGVQQSVVALLTKLRLARNQLSRGDSPEALLAETQTVASELLTDLRELAHGIHPPVLTDGGLVAAVEARAGRLPLGVSVRADEAARETRFGPEVEAAAYFVACEALTNVVKHAEARMAVVMMSTRDGNLSLQVHDDGAGFNGSGAKGQGLTNLRDRVETLGGQLSIEGRPGGGTIVTATLPVRGSDG